ncbi:MAG TPA: biotin/lipoyl-binding protein, partial [Polymorphobacter sp.]|nr:biotin/lipoyl-binding protein [Polymorphobacter sp.]
MDAPQYPGQSLAERLGRWSKPAFGALLAVAVGVGVWIFYGQKDAPPPPPQAAPVVTVSVPGTTMVESTVRGTGSIAARRDMPVGVQGEGGRVTSVLVDAGQFVRAGQVLATIDKAVQTQQLAQMQAGSRSARADAALAQAELDRAQALVSKGFISKADIDR